MYSFQDPTRPAKPIWRSKSGISAKKMKKRKRKSMTRTLLSEEAVVGFSVEEELGIVNWGLT